MGSGKTTLACMLAETLDRDAHNKTRFPLVGTRKEFNEKGQIVETKVHVPRLINSISDFERDRVRKMPDGSAFILDETQVILNSKEAMSKKNRRFNALISTGRVFNNIIFLTLPNYTYLDKELKGYIDGVIEVLGHEGEWTKYTAYRLKKVKQFNGVVDIWELPFYSKKDEFGLNDAVGAFWAKSPSRELLDAIDEKSRRWKELFSLGRVRADGTILDKGESILPKTRREIKDESYDTMARTFFEENKDKREAFRVGKKDHFSVNRIRSFGNLPVRVAHKVAVMFETMYKE